MGLTISEYPVYKNAATVNAYVNIRDITQNKENDIFSLNGFAKISTNNINIDSLYIRLTSTEVFINSWDSLYVELKRTLTEKGLVFVDS
jgi:hypothetical protein